MQVLKAGDVVGIDPFLIRISKLNFYLLIVFILQSDLAPGG